MGETDLDICRRAIAYVKRPRSGEVPADLSLASDDAPVIFNLNNGLVVVFVAGEREKEFEFVQNRHLRGAGISADDLLQTALRNLASAVEGRLTLFRAPGCHVVNAGGKFEASLLLIDSLWDETFAGVVQGDFLVAIPTRDTLAFAGSSEPSALGHLQTLITGLGSAPNHAITTTIYRRKNRRWVQYAA